MYFPVFELLYINVKDSEKALNYIFSFEFFSSLCFMKCNNLIFNYLVCFLLFFFINYNKKNIFF